MKKYIIDSIEDGIVACENEDKTMDYVPLGEFIVPEGHDLKEGDCIQVDDSLNVTIDENERNERESHINELMNRLIKNN